ncbi:MAG: hypothetical protein HQK56_08290 [Deltaproteobacteria bacterium]|nr:hypothetical protein [Deltaproteobacteria bacterium]
MHYDISSKLLIEMSQKEILRRLVGLPVLESELLEALPQETASLMRSDFPIMWTNEAGQRQLVLLEIQTRWEKTVPRRLLAYRSRYQLKYNLDAISCVLLLRASKAATDHYRDQEIDYRYRLIRVNELDAQQIIEQGVLSLMPFVPLMRFGKKLASRAGEFIYESSLSKDDKAVMLTSMAILAAMVSTKLAQELFLRRKDFMIESPAFKMFAKDAFNRGLTQGIEKGIEKGIKKGIEEGIKEGIKEGEEKGKMEGMIRASRENLLEILKERFEKLPRKMLQSLNKVKDPDLLKSLIKLAVKVESLAYFKQHLEEVTKNT